MGTPDFAVPSLEALIEGRFRVVVVVTAPDRPAGRGRKMTAPAVKEAALRHGIPVLQPKNLKDPAFAEQLKSFGVNLQVVVAFRMLPEVVWRLPEHGTFNLHASLLPDYRGAAPINWAVINGETRTGATTFFIDAQIDTGHIILQEATPIGPEETAGQLHDRLMHLGAGLVVETARKIASGTVETRPQKHLESPNKAPKLTRENTRIQWDAAAAAVHDQIRGLCPYPGAWTELQNGTERLNVKVFRTAKAGMREPGAPGALLREGRRLFAATATGWLELLEMQFPGKRRMPVGNILNGFDLEKKARFL